MRPTQGARFARGEPRAIYQRIYADKRNGGTLRRALRCQKVRRKRYGGRERRGTIPNQVSIEQRPAIVNSRRRFGDWEGDLIIGAGQQQALVTLNERKSRYCLIAHVPSKSAPAVSDTVISLLTVFGDCQCALGWHMGDQAVTGLAFVERDERLLLTGAEMIQIALPSRRSVCTDDGRTLLDRDLVGDGAALLRARRRRFLRTF